MEAGQGVGVIVDEEHREVYKQIAELLKAKIGASEKGDVHVPFSFFAKAKTCACTMAGTCACTKVKEHVLVIGSRILKQVGIGFGLERLEIREANPWAVYSALALLIINAGIGTGT